VIKKRKEKRAVRWPLFFHGRKADEEVVRDKREGNRKRNEKQATEKGT
jgi:hypothetical protein